MERQVDQLDDPFALPNLLEKVLTRFTRDSNISLAQASKGFVDDFISRGGDIFKLAPALMDQTSIEPGDLDLDYKLPEIGRAHSWEELMAGIAADILTEELKLDDDLVVEDGRRFHLEKGLTSG